MDYLQQSQTVPYDKAVELVKAAANRVLEAHQSWVQAGQNPHSSFIDRQRARLRLESCECEFGWQWKNVLTIFKEKGI